MFRLTGASCVIAVLAIFTSACSQPAPAKPEMIPFQLGTLSDAARQTDKGPGLHHYTELYERLLFDLKNQPVRIFEIGIEDGGSIKMWQEYFPKSSVIAVDINPKKMFDNERVRTFVADQASREQLNKVLESAGRDFDIILDDGGHTMEQQQVSLGLLFRSVKPGGYYIVEDVHTSIPELWKGYGVSADRGNTTLKMIQDYMAAAPPRFTSGYMTADELAYLNQHVESVNLHYRTESRSIVSVLRKTAAAR